jgi:hypothetical protein
MIIFYKGGCCRDKALPCLCNLKVGIRVEMGFKPISTFPVSQRDMLIFNKQPLQILPAPVFQQSQH